MPQATPDGLTDESEPADWHRRVVGRSLGTAAKRSIDRSSNLIRAAATLLERSGGEGFTVQDVADLAGQSLRTLYQYFESKDDLLLAVFEEAMRTYARGIDRAIAELDDPLERLAGASIAALRMPEHSGAGVGRGLARLRTNLGEVEPELIARSQEPVTSLIRGLVVAAAAAGEIDVSDIDGATFILLSLRSAYITSVTLGNDHGVDLPSLYMLTGFCLKGLGADVDEARLADIDARLHMPTSALELGG
jgi:AcrR family transcriptional regulator